MNKIIKSFFLFVSTISLFSCKAEEEKSGELTRDEALQFIKRNYTKEAKKPSDGLISWDYSTCKDEISRALAINGITFQYTYYDNEVKVIIKSKPKWDEPTSIPQSSVEFYNELVEDREIIDRGIVFISMNEKYFSYLESRDNYKHTFMVKDKCLTIFSEYVNEIGGVSKLIHAYNQEGHEINFQEFVSNSKLSLDYYVNIDFKY